MRSGRRFRGAGRIAASCAACSLPTFRAEVLSHKTEADVLVDEPQHPPMGELLLHLSLWLSRRCWTPRCTTSPLRETSQSAHSRTSHPPDCPPPLPCAPTKTGWAPAKHSA